MIKLNDNTLTQEFRRIFHGRGSELEYKSVTIDSIDKILFVQFFNEEKTEIIEFLKEYIKTSRHETLLVKNRITNELKIVIGKLEKENFVIENGFKFKVNFYNQNIGYFGDMKNSREFIYNISENKKVLNLFSYTCGFSLYAKKAKARKIINMDMSKSALSIGMKNHSINGFDMKNISFWPHNILKSFSKIKKNAPYDIIIIDPPTYQTNFIAKNDYFKIISRLDSFCNDETIVLACLNSPEYDENYLIDLIENNTKLTFKKRIKNLEEYENNEKSDLKSLVFGRDR